MNRYHEWGDSIHEKGVEVSQFCKWDGKDITEVYLEALTDSNFHTLRRKIAEFINKEENWDLD